MSVLPMVQPDVLIDDAEMLEHLNINEMSQTIFTVFLLPRLPPVLRSGNAESGMDEASSRRWRLSDVRGLKALHPEWVNALRDVCAMTPGQRNKFLRAGNSPLLTQPNKASEANA